MTDAGLGSRNVGDEHPNSEGGRVWDRSHERAARVQPDSTAIGAPSKIMVVGSTMMDMVAYLPTFPHPGQTVVGDSFVLGFGGKGANQAVMASLLGASVAMVNCVGDDVFGATTIENLRSFGIDVSSTRVVPGRATGCAPIWVGPDGTNRIVVVLGANGCVSPSLVDEAFVQMPIPDVLLSQFEIPQETIAHAFRRGLDVGAINILNSAPAQLLDPGLLSMTTWVIANEEEFLFMAGLNGPDIGGYSDLVVDHAEKWGTNLLVTLGSAGLVYCEQGKRDAVVVPADAVVAVDTTGAGDAFVGAFADAIAGGRELFAAATFASQCAAATVTRRGTQSSFPRAEQLRLLQSQSLWR